MTDKTQDDARTKSENTTDTTEIEVSKEEVIDPDDYAQNQTIKAIHDARAEVRGQIADMDINENEGNTIYRYSVTELAHKTTAYVLELKPLIDQSEIEDERLELSDMCANEDILTFALSMGLKEDGKPVSPLESIQVYERCNSLASDLGLGANLKDGEEGLSL